MNDFEYFFIVGVGRSGTTLLQSMLNAHPQLAMTPETHFVLCQLIQCPDASLDQAKRRMLEDPRYQRLGLDLDQVLKPFVDGDESFSMAALFLRLLRCYAQRQGVRIVGDKAPKNVEYLPILHEVAPCSKVIHLIRDPRDVLLSRRKAHWSARRPDVLQHLAYRAQTDLGRTIGPNLFRDRYLEVFYENLVGDPQSVLDRIVRFLCVPYDEKMIRFSESASQLVANDERSWKQNVTGPLLKQNVNKWQQQMTPRQAARAEAACWPVFRNGTYARSVTRPDRLGLSGWCTNALMVILSAAYRAKVHRLNRRVCRLIQRQR